MYRRDASWMLHVETFFFLFLPSSALLADPPPPPPPHASLLSLALPPPRQRFVCACVRASVAKGLAQSSGRILFPGFYIQMVARSLPAAGPAAAAAADCRTHKRISTAVCAIIRRLDAAAAAHALTLLLIEPIFNDKKKERRMQRLPILCPCQVKREKSHFL